MSTRRRPGLSVIVPTRDRPVDLAACVESVVHADNGALREIVIVDDGSRRPVSAAAFTECEVRVLRHDWAAGADASRNDAVAAATGDYVGFLDDDARMVPDWFGVACAAIESGQRVFTGRIMPFDRGIVSRARQWRYDVRYRDLRAGQPVQFLAGGNSVVPRADFLAVGGFPVRAAGGDNGLVSRLAGVGLCCVFEPDLRVLHRNGKGMVRAARQSWSAGDSMPPQPVSASLAECGRTLRSLRAAPLPIAAVNGALQLANTTARVARKVRS